MQSVEGAASVGLSVFWVIGGDGTRMFSMKHPPIRTRERMVGAWSTGRGTGVGDPRYEGRRWVYTQLSGGTGGLSVGINLTPGRECDYRCRYCAVRKESTREPEPIDGHLLARELEATLESIRTGAVFRSPAYLRLPGDLRALGQVLLSGEGEPTLCPNFLEVVETLIHARARGRHPFFRLILETNGSGLDRAEVIEGIGHFTAHDEVWLKLDAGTGERFRQVNGAGIPFDRVLARILDLGRRRPVVIHSLFVKLDGHPPSETEIAAYLRRLNDLRERGAVISRVQITSVIRPPPDPECTPLPLGSLSEIARRVRREVGIDAEVF